MECCDMTLVAYSLLGTIIFFIVLYIGFCLEDKAFKDVQELVEREHEARRAESEELMKKIKESLKRSGKDTL